MTAVLTLETIEDPAAEYVTLNEMLLPTVGQRIFPMQGYRWAIHVGVKDLLYCMMLPSANEAANALADYIIRGIFPPLSHR
jgi:D-alanyl-D-alanine carboxypeptidase